MVMAQLYDIPVDRYSPELKFVVEECCLPQTLSDLVLYSANSKQYEKQCHITEGNRVLNELYGNLLQLQH